MQSSRQWTDSVKTSSPTCSLPVQAALDITITNPTGYSTSFFNDLSNLGSGATRIADVVLSQSYTSFGATEKAAVTSFLESGGGLVIGGQAW
jgi:hypothetical protein